MDTVAHRHTHPSESLLLSEIQVLLAEKRTYYALMRTSMASASLPPTIILFLIATKDYHGFFNNFWSAYIVVTMLGIISFVGMYSLYRIVKKIRYLTGLIETIKRENKRLAEIII